MSLVEVTLLRCCSIRKVICVPEQLAVWTTTLKAKDIMLPKARVCHAQRDPDTGEVDYVGVLKASAP